MTSFGLLAYLWKSAALLAKVAQFAAKSQMNLTNNHDFSDPWTLDPCLRTGPAPPANVKVHANMATAEIR